VQEPQTHAPHARGQPSNSLAKLYQTFLHQLLALHRVDRAPLSHGLVTNGVDLLNKMDLMVYPVDQDLCIEGVGIAAMEALVLGVPVVIANKNSTDFFELNSIIDFRELENAIKLYDKDKFIHYISQLKMQANQNMSIAKHNFSIGNYINNLVQVALSIREYKKI
jgi:glycosyltransferase involved in cell wall biosynthesis